MDIKFAGCLWQGAEDVHFSGYLNGEIVFFKAHRWEQRIRQLADERGISVGAMCDEINQQISNAQRQARVESGMPFVEWEIKLTAEQSKQWHDLMFGGK